MFVLCSKEKKSERVESTNLQLNVQGDSNFTAPTIKPIKKLIKITKHSLDIRLQMCVINFPVSLHSEHSDFEQKKSFSY
jgi:hypothetical protein